MRKGNAKGGAEMTVRPGTHYEAMDVDTPPRPSASFPPSATQTADPFHFSDQANAFSAASAPPHPLAFDAGGFHPKEAFGLADEPAIQEISMTADDGPSEILDDSADKQGLEVMLREDEGESKSRKGSGQAKKRTSRRRKPTTDDEGTDASDADDSGSGPGFLDVLKAKKGRRAGDSQFSFQVHHHHAPQGGISPGVPGLDAATAVQPPPERWLRKSTPYVLLG